MSRLKVQRAESILRENDEQKLSVNEIFYQRYKNELTYYLPTYLQLKFNNITSIDFKALQSKVNCEFTLRVCVLGLGQILIDYIKKNMKFHFNHD